MGRPREEQSTRRGVKSVTHLGKGNQNTLTGHSNIRLGKGWCDVIGPSDACVVRWSKHSKHHITVRECAEVCCAETDKSILRFATNT